MPSKGQYNISLQISNGNNVTYKEILLRKLFGMVFIDSTGKKLNIFIATVFGGIAADKRDDGFPLPNYKKAGNTTCFLDFKFESDLLDLPKCTVSDISGKFWEQRQAIAQVWCDSADEKSEAFEYKNDQNKVTQMIQQMYPTLYPKGATVDISVNPQWSEFYGVIRQSSKSTHQFMAVKGKVEFDNAKKGEYKISMPTLEDGLEATNWVQVDLALKESILNRRVTFSIEFDPDKQNEGQTVFYTPDFTWYFAPPMGLMVNENTAILKLGEKEILNNIQSVRDDTTVLFEEWVALNIVERKKARIQLKQLDDWHPPYTLLSEKKSLAIIIETSNPQASSNRQFLMGLMVAFILSFCSDKTRINDFYECLHQTCDCIPAMANGAVAAECFCKSFCNGISFFAPVLVLMTLYTFACRPRDCIFPNWEEGHPKLYKALKWGRYLTILVFLLLIIYIFCIWPIAAEFVGRYITCTLNRAIIIFLAAACFILNLAFILIMKLKFKAQPKY